MGRTKAGRPKAYLCREPNHQGGTRTYVTGRPNYQVGGMEVIGTAYIEEGSFVEKGDDPAYKAQIWKRLARLKARKGLIKSPFGGWIKIPTHWGANG